MAILALLASVMLLDCRTRLEAVNRAAMISRVHGLGVNCHSQMLPVAKLKSIGVQWVRIDIEPGFETPELIQKLVKHYEDFGQLWILKQHCTDLDGFADELLRLGVSDLEFYNEPNLAGISPEEYVQSFRRMKVRLHGRARLYGPCISKWFDFNRYVDECFRLGMDPDVLSIHGYSGDPDRNLNAALDAEKFGYPVVVSELGYPVDLGGKPYRSIIAGRNSVADLFLRTKKLLEGRTWCWYDGPNPPEVEGMGLFDFDGRNFTIPTQSFLIIKSEIDREHNRQISSLK